MDNQVVKLGSNSSRFSIIVRFTVIYAGVLIPVMAFVGGLKFMPEFQSKAIVNYVWLLLNPVTTWAFWPIIVYSMVCLFLVISNHETSQRPVIRVGLYLGVLWSFQYMVLLVVGLFDTKSWIFYEDGRRFIPSSQAVLLCFGVLITLFPAFLVFCFNGLSKKTGRIVNSFLIFILFVLAMLLSYYLTHSILTRVYSTAYRMPDDIILALLAPAPFWSFTAYLYLSNYAYRKNGGEKLFSLLKSRSCLCWIGGYLMAWGLSISSMLIFYSKLPKK